MHRKKLVVAAIFAIAGLAAFAGTCTVTHLSLVQTDGAHDTFGGQLDNTSGVNILQHNFVVAFLDSGNNVVEVKTVPGCLRSVQSGTSDFFSATSTQPSANTNVGLARIAFDSAFKVGTVATGDVTLSTVAASRNGITLVVTGTITNNDTVTLVEPQVCVVVRDASGNVVITGVATNISNLAQNANDGFSVAITVPNDSTAATVDVWADGLFGDANAAPIAPASDLGNTIGNGTPTPTSTPATATPTSTPITPTATGTPPTATSTTAATNTPAPTNTPLPPTATATP